MLFGNLERDRCSLDWVLARGRQMVSRKMERLGGLFIATVSAILTIWTWHSAIYAGSFYPKAATIGPAFTIIGVALILFPGYRNERIERGEDIQRLSGSELVTPRWWAIMAIALGSGFLNLAVLKGG
jgi:hypothetical protein